jgi:ABC-type branched-subunit amino acid transport system substrate-binding protein
MRWMANEVGVRKWCIVGNDYVWPRRSAAASRVYAPACGAEIRDEIFLELGTTDFASTIGRIESSACDGVLMFLVGADAVEFNRQFADRGLEDRCFRLTPLMDENMLLASGDRSVARLFTASGYFQALPTAENLEFDARYSRRFGEQAPVLNSLGESCYEGMQLLAALVRQAGSADVRLLSSVARLTEYEGPRGALHLDGSHVRQRVYLARPDGLDYDIIASL